MTCLRINIARLGVGLMGLLLIATLAGACGNSGAGAVAEIGSGVYLSGCATCHGSIEEEQPRNPVGSFPAPPHGPTGHTWRHPDGQLFRMVRDGVAGIPDLAIKSGMPEFGGLLSDDQIVAVIEYLKTGWEPDQRDFQTEVTSDTGDGYP